MLNASFLHKVHRDFPRYVATTTNNTKRQIARELYEEISRAGGLFYEENGAVMAEKAALQKIMKALKDAGWKARQNGVMDCNEDRQSLYTIDMTDFESPSVDGPHVRQIPLEWQGSLPEAVPLSPYYEEPDHLRELPLPMIISIPEPVAIEQDILDVAQDFTIEDNEMDSLWQDEDMYDFEIPAVAELDAEIEAYFLYNGFW